MWICQAADVLAMAPTTNIGSSTPINGERREHRQRPAAQGRQRRGRLAARLAESHGRNAKWADLAVRKASNLTAQEALQMNVIDLIAPTLPALLNKIDGRKTKPRKGFVAAHRRRADRRREARASSRGC